jgi:hypothetical protein
MSEVGQKEQLPRKMLLPEHCSRMRNQPLMRVGMAEEAGRAGKNEDLLWEGLAEAAVTEIRESGVYRSDSRCSGLGPLRGQHRQNDQWRADGLRSITGADPFAVGIGCSAGIGCGRRLHESLQSSSLAGCRDPVCDRHHTVKQCGMSFCPSGGPPHERRSRARRTPSSAPGNWPR